MFISTRKFLIRRVGRGNLLLFLVFAPIVCWILSKCFSTLFQGEEWNQMEKDETIKTEAILNDSEGSETYPIDIRYFPEPILRNHEKYLLQVYDDPKYLNELKEMLKENELSRVINFEDDFLRSFITSNDYIIYQAFSKIQNFLNLKIDHNYFFHNVSFDFTQNPAYRFVTVLPHRRKDGSATILFELAKWDPNIVPLEHLKQLLFIICIQALRNPVTQASGLNLIYDFANAGLQYIKYGTPQNLFLLHHVTFDVMPAKYVGYHLVNMNVIGSFMVTVSRIFLPASIDSIFHIHSSGEGLLEFFPRSMLPLQYGGNLTEYYAADWIRNANQQHGHFPAEGQKNIF